MRSADETAKGLSELIRDIKGRSIDYKKALETHAATPWDREVETQRQNLRRLIMKVMFAYPDDPIITKLEGSLWIDTSHTLIDRYRKLVAEMQAKIAKSASADQPRGQGRGAHSKQGEVGAVALRKLLNRFRGFLGSEEKFWTQLATRFARTFNLSEAELGLASLSLMATDPEDLVHTPDVGIAVSTPEHAQARSSAKKLLFLQKCLISLGDLARYREQYNEQGGRPPAGRESHEARKHDKRGGKTAPRPRDYSKSLGFYQQAKLLLPNEGHPSNQLAILSLYDGDHFEAAVNYYRALCVQQPFPTSRDNLLRSLQKAREASKVVSASAGAVDVMKLRILELHACWYYEPRVSEAAEVSENVLSAFATLLAERSLTSDTIINVITMAVAAMWSTQVYSSDKGTEQPQEHQQLVERVILAHIIDLFRVLVTVSSGQIAEAVAASLRDETASGGLVRFITAPFRRILPALRVSSQWLRFNIEHIQRHTAGPLQGANNRTVGDALRGFWTAYTTFVSQVDRVFPIEQLPKSIILLDEDVELRGFIPFQYSGISDAMAGLSAIADSAKVHPNEEHLMRLRDIQQDAAYFASMKNPPIVMHNGEYSVSDATILGSAPLDRDPLRPHETISDAGDVEDDSRTVSTEDPVGLAMSATLDEQAEDDEDDEEQILYPRMPSGAPKALLSIAASSTNAFPPPLSSVGGSAPHRVPAGTTAEDLLSRVLGQASPSRGAAHLRTSSDPSLPPLTGSPLGGSAHIQVQPPNFEHMYPTANQYVQANSIMSVSSMTSVSPYEQSPGVFDRAVGGASLQAGPPYSVSTPPIHFRPPTALSPIKYAPGPPRALNPPGAIGSLPHHTSVQGYHPSHHERSQNVGGSLLTPSQLFSRLAE